eukprot:244267-Chlamydomonas_euryale.AAC.1
MPALGARMQAWVCMRAGLVVDTMPAPGVHAGMGSHACGAGGRHHASTGRAHAGMGLHACGAGGRHHASTGRAHAGIGSHACG